MALPETVLTMVQARLEALEPEARRVLRAASVFGQTFWRGGVVALLAGEDSDAHVTAWLDELVRARDRQPARGDEVPRRAGVRLPPRVRRRGRVHDAHRQGPRRSVTSSPRSGSRRSARARPSCSPSTSSAAASRSARSRSTVAPRRRRSRATTSRRASQRADAGIACGAEGEVLGRLALRKAEAHRWRGENLAAQGVRRAGARAPAARRAPLVPRRRRGGRGRARVSATRASFIARSTTSAT